MEDNLFEKFLTSPVAKNLDELLIAHDAMSDMSFAVS